MRVIAKANTYQLFFNLKRPNSYKEMKTPWQLAYEKRVDIDKRLFMIPSVDLDVLLDWKLKFSTQGGNDLLTVPFEIMATENNWRKYKKMSGEVRFVARRVG